MRLEIRGAASAEEIAALLAVLGGAQPVAPTGFEQWRRTRQAALKPRREGR